MGGKAEEPSSEEDARPSRYRREGGDDSDTSVTLPSPTPVPYRRDEICQHLDTTIAQPVGAADNVHESNQEPDRKPDLRQAVEPTDGPQDEDSDLEIISKRKSELEDALLSLRMSYMSVKMELNNTCGEIVAYSTRRTTQRKARG